MLNVMFLGTNGSVQERESGNTSIIVSNGKANVLVDVSVNIQEAVRAQIQALVITHNHIDHVYGLPSILHQMWLTGRTAKLDIICPEGIMDTVNSLIDIFAIRTKKNIFPIDVLASSEHSYEGLSFSAFKTDHTPASIGLVFQDNESKIVYTADTRPIAEPDKAWLNADILIHETSGLVENEETLIKKGHSSAVDAARLAASMNAKRLLLCHLPASSEKQAIVDQARSLFTESEIPQVLVKYFTR